MRSADSAKTMSSPGEPKALSFEVESPLKVESAVKNVHPQHWLRKHWFKKASTPAAKKKISFKKALV